MTPVPEEPSVEDKINKLGGVSEHFLSTPYLGLSKRLFCCFRFRSVSHVNIVTLLIKSSGILASEEAEIMLKMLKSRETDVDPEADNEAEGVNWGFRYGQRNRPVFFVEKYLGY